jgi:hypothetical protein
MKIKVEQTGLGQFYHNKQQNEHVVLIFKSQTYPNDPKTCRLSLKRSLTNRI